MANEFDPYRILGVDRTASADDVQAAYERLKTEAPEGSERRREVETAYAVVGSAEGRREYDSRLSARELSGVLPPPAEALAAAGKPAAGAGVPWTPRDIAIALILPLLLIALNVGASLATDVDTDDLTETDHIVGFGFGFSVRTAKSQPNAEERIGEFGWGGAVSTHFWVSPNDDQLVVVTMESQLRQAHRSILPL